jgi:GAF domain-containing protein
VIDRGLLVNELYGFVQKLVTDCPVSDALHDLVDATTAILDIHGAGVSLAQHGSLSFATAGSEDIAELEQIQEQAQAGPCIDAFRSGRPVLVADLTELTEATRRWPQLREAALRRGIIAVAGIPLHLNGVGLGAVDLYDVRRHDWTPDEAGTAALIAALAAGYVANASHLDQARHTAQQLQEALDSRVVIEQAKGVLAGERGISVDEAFEVLRKHARSNGAPLRDVARAVVHLGLRP